MTDSTLVYLSAVAWDDVEGTDRMLTSALARIVPVIWVDPPISAARHARALFNRQPQHIGISSVEPGINRLRVVTVPGTFRFGLRDLAALHLSWKVRRVTRDESDVIAVVVAGFEGRFNRNTPGKRVFFVTDDWVQGAGLMGVNPRRITARIKHTVRSADVTAAVTVDLAETISKISGGYPVDLLANGCTPMDPAPMEMARRPNDMPPGPVVGLVGQINERLDLRIIKAVADAGVTTVIIGPRTERDPNTTRELDALFRHPNVHWLGRKPQAELPSYLASMSAGLTPYVDSPFNRASFPLKTLEYLAAGLPVISTDLPSVRWLGTSHIHVADSPSSFTRLAAELAASPIDPSLIADRIEFARSHSWDRRAQQLLQLIQRPSSRIGA